MSEEEIKAIETLKEDMKTAEQYRKDMLVCVFRNHLQVVLNLIENSVSKDSIRKEIDILEEIGEYSAAHFMKELLEE